MKVLYINSVCGFGSTGRIVASLASSNKYESLVCFGRKQDYANTNSYQFANFFDNALAAFKTIVLDDNLNQANMATKRLINKIKEYQPDIIHLHNLHGYYLSVEPLLKFLKEYDKPVVYTMHDVWPITGYCCTYAYNDCDKFSKACIKCPCGFSYPYSLFKQRVSKEFKKKNELLRNLPDLTIVTPSNWMKEMANRSYLKDKEIKVINNGISLDNFKPNKKENSIFTILAISSIWDDSKGLDDLNKLVDLLSDDIQLVVVGKNSNKVKKAITIDHTDDIDELIKLYSSADLFINPTHFDNFPTVNIEALACGTPVITYNTGGSREIIDEKSGIVVKKGDYQSMAKCINHLKDNYFFKREDCLKRAQLFSDKLMIERYEQLYESLMVK